MHSLITTGGGGSPGTGPTGRQSWLAITSSASPRDVRACSGRRRQTPRARDGRASRASRPRCPPSQCRRVGWRTIDADLKVRSGDGARRRQVRARKDGFGLIASPAGALEHARIVSPGGRGEFVQQFHSCTTQSIATRESEIRLNYSNAIIMAVEQFFGRSSTGSSTWWTHATLLDCATQIEGRANVELARFLPHFS